MHSALRPRGLLLDVRPAPDHPWIAIKRVAATDGSERLIRLGQVDDSYRMGTLAIADAALQTVIAAGRFAPERAETFTFAYHFEGVEAMLAYMAERWSTAQVSDELIARVRGELAREAGETLALRAIRAERLRRL